jgi:autotransporter-associated beta strand protein
MVLNGANTYTGPTLVSAGKLLVNGSTSATSAFTVQNTATLGGSGTIGGSVAVQSGGTLAPGGGFGTTTPAVLNTGALALAGSLSIDAAKAGIRAGVQPLVGTDYDQANVTGTVDVTGANLGLALTSGLESGDILFIIKNDLTDAVTGSFTKLNGVTTTLGEGSTFTTGYATFQISYLADADTSSFTGGNDIALSAIAAPEPTSLCLLGLGMAGLMARRRRRSMVVAPR